MDARVSTPLSVTLVIAGMGGAVASGASSTAAPSADAGPAPTLSWEVLSRRGHDTTAFTEGLVFDAQGRLFESTGLIGRSTLRELDPESGALLRVVALSADLFGEGLAAVDDQLIQLTWKDGLAFRYDAATFDLIDTYDYTGEGWGLCDDGQRLVQSDGSAELTFRSRQTFEPLGSIEVTLDGQPVLDLNELECVDGTVWANVWQTDQVVRIDPVHGRVTGVLDLAGLLDPSPAASNPDAVLNGIAYDAARGTFLFTGKDWPELIELRVRDPSEVS
jgi:glutaminyl-peptide cyclotransferase